MQKLSRTLFLLAALSCQVAIAKTPAVANKSMPASLAPVLQKVIPAVVNISVQGDAAGGNMKTHSPKESEVPPTDRQAPQDRNPSRKFRSAASGVIIDTKRGYVLTNAHVIRDAMTITVKLYDGRSLKAKLIGSDPVSDVAVLQIKPNDLMTLPIADSNKVKVGDFAIAIGNPFNLDYFGTNQTATFGIVSALGRSDLHIEGVENFIQTDAAINPGNSGGALINMQGELIGINTAIISPYGGNVGIGFAIPINMARDIAKQLIKYGSIHRGLMGIFVQQFTPELAEAFGIPKTKGALVTQVNKGSPAEEAGLKTGDLILSINNIAISSAAQVKNIIQLLRVDSKVKMKILRSHKEMVIHANIIDMQEHQQHQQQSQPYLYGLGLRNFSQTTPIHGMIVGVQILGASEASAGWRAGIRPGDVIISANGKKTTDVKELEKISREADKQLLVHLIRGGGSLYFVVK